MSVLIATPKALDANAYVTVAAADLIIDKRLYGASWVNATSVPDAEGYLVDGAHSAGATTVAIKTGTGTFTAGSRLQFDGDATVYTVGSAQSGAGDLSITPALVAELSGDETLARISANDKERALMWASQLFDEMLVYNGRPTTTDQAMRWPRYSVPDADGDWYDPDTIPTLLEVATAEMGLTLLQSDRFKPPAALGLGVSKVEAGPAKVTIDEHATVPVIPDNILSLLSPLGSLEPEAQGGTRIVPVGRS